MGGLRVLKESLEIHINLIFVQIKYTVYFNFDVNLKGMRGFN